MTLQSLFFFILKIITLSCWFFIYSSCE